LTIHTACPLFGPPREPVAASLVHLTSVIVGPVSWQARKKATAVASATDAVTGPDWKEKAIGAGV
jgi:hypothetical protein